MEVEFKELDVRPILANGGEPFQAIMTAVDDLRPGQGLRLRAPFRPEPLLTVMERKGFTHSMTELEGGDFEVRFLPRNAAVLVSDDSATAENWPEPVLALDLSALEPPQPMVRILSELEGLAPGEVLFAVLAREPMFLFPELSRRGHQWAGSLDAAGAAFRIMIRRGGDPT